jgi:hypothetical protein
LVGHDLGVSLRWGRARARGTRIRTAGVACGRRRVAASDHAHRALTGRTTISGPSTRTSTRFLCCNVGSTNAMTCSNALALLPCKNREAHWSPRGRDERDVHAEVQAKTGGGTNGHGPVLDPAALATCSTLKVRSSPSGVGGEAGIRPPVGRGGRVGPGPAGRAAAPSPSTDCAFRPRSGGCSRPPPFMLTGALTRRATPAAGLGPGPASAVRARLRRRPLRAARTGGR